MAIMIVRKEQLSYVYCDNQIEGFFNPSPQYEADKTGIPCSWGY